jgi:hypothetical protein
MNVIFAIVFVPSHSFVLLAVLVDTAITVQRAAYVCFIPKEKVTDLVEDRAEILVMDPLGHLRNNFQSPLAEVK